MPDPIFGEIGQLDARYPMTLMPLRLETRFRRGPVAGSPEAAGELLVRIYPDSILADSHEPLLTPNEVAAGQDYWRRAFADGRENDAWTALLGEVRTHARPGSLRERRQPMWRRWLDAGPRQRFRRRKPAQRAGTERPAHMACPSVG